MVMRQDASTGQMVESAETDEEKAAREANPQNGKPTMSVKVYAPFQIYYEGDAYSVTALNESGPFDILPHHKNFICMLMPCNLVLKTPYEEKIVKISRALMHVKADRVVVFVDV